MQDFRKVATQVYQAKEELVSVLERIAEGDAPGDPPIEKHMRAVDVLLVEALDEMDLMNLREEEIVYQYCEMARSVLSDARSAAFHSKLREVPDRKSIVATLDLVEKAAASAFREAAGVEEIPI